MTISSENRKAGPYLGNDVATVFSFAFKVFVKTDVRVVHTDASAVESDFVLDVDYSVFLNADQDANPGGSITYPLMGTPLATGHKLTVLSQVPNKQLTDITNGGGFFPQIVEDALDVATILLQQVKEIVSRSITIPTSVSGVSTQVPAPQANSVFGWNAAGTALVNYIVQVGTSLVDLAASTGATLIGFLQSGLGEVTTTVSAELRSSKTMRAWYVDSVAGNNAYSGRTPNAALSTIATLLTKSIQAGDTIYLKRGSYWREQLTLPDDTIQVEAYGDGVDPILDGADVIAAGAWVKVGGLVNVYSAVVITDAGSLGAASNHASVWINGVRLVQATSAANCDATAGSYYPNTTVDASPLTLYVHSTGNTDPRVDGKTYEYAKRSACVDSFSVEHCDIKSITTKRAFQSYGSLRLGKYCRAYDCNANEGNKHNVFLRGAAKAYRVVANDAYNADGSGVAMFVHFEAAAASENVLYEDCTAILTTANPNTVTGFYGHTSGGVFGTATYRRCVSTGCDTPYSGANGALLDYRDCDASNYAQAFIPLVNAKISGGVQSTTRAGANVVLSNTVGLTIDVDGITATNNSAGGSVIACSANGNNITVKRSTLSWNSTLVNIVGTGGSFTANFNKYIPLAGATQAYLLPGNPTLTSDNNDFGGVSDGAAAWVVNTSNYYRIESYTAGTGQDTNSVNGASKRPYQMLRLFDDFLGDQLADQWNGRVGSDGACVAPANLPNITRGLIRLTSGAGAGADMATNGCLLESQLSWQPSLGACVFEARIRMDAITNICVFLGVTDQDSALEMPFTLAAGDVLTSNASDAVGALFDTAADTDNWWLVGVKADVDAAKQNTAVAPVANTLETWRIEITSATGAARFYRNNTLIGVSMANAITNGISITPVIALFSRNAASRKVDADYVLMESNR